MWNCVSCCCSTYWGAGIERWSPPARKKWIYFKAGETVLGLGSMLGSGLVVRAKEVSEEVSVVVVSIFVAWMFCSFITLNYGNYRLGVRREQLREELAGLRAIGIVSQSVPSLERPFERAQSPEPTLPSSTQTA